EIRKADDRGIAHALQVYALPVDTEYSAALGAGSAEDERNKVADSGADQNWQSANEALAKNGDRNNRKHGDDGQGHIALGQRLGTAPGEVKPDNGHHCTSHNR